MSVHEDALREFNAIQMAQREERLQCLLDRRFYSIAGAQWEDRLGLQFENRPKLEINKIHLAVMRIINEMRNNRITVDFIDTDDDPATSLADTLDGLYRASEQDSDADEAYDNAFEEAVGGGFGAWRVRNVYEDEGDPENDCQKIVFEPIYDADSCVYFNLGAERQDKKDAKCCFVLTGMTLGDFEERFPGKNASPVSKTVNRTEFDWTKANTIYVAEYYKVEEKKEKLFIYKTFDENEERYTQADFDSQPELKTQLAAVGTILDRTRTIKKKKVHKYIMSGSEILEDQGLIAGNNIPIIPVYGKRWVVDGIERQAGHVRYSKDMQRLKNMQMSKLAEISALSSVEKPIVTPAMIKGHEQTWADDNIENYAYVTVNPTVDKDGNVTGVGPTSYLKSPNIPPALAELIALSEQDLKDLLGNQEAGEEIAANLSGKAVELVQTRLDMQTYIYVSNLAKAMKRCGEVWLGMAKEVYVANDKDLKLAKRGGGSEKVKLNEKTVDATGKTVLKNDIANASCTISTEVGPSSASKRSGVVRMLTSMLNFVQDPEMQKILSSMAMMNMDGEGLSEVRAYFRGSLLRMGVLTPTSSEQKMLDEEARNAQPTPNDKYLLAAAEEAEAKAQKTRVDAGQSLAKTENLSAKTLEILAGIDRNERQAAIENLQLLNTPAPTQPTPG